MIKTWLTSPKDKAKLGEIWLWVSLAGIGTGGTFSISLYWLIDGGGILFMNILLLVVSLVGICLLFGLPIAFLMPPLINNNEGQDKNAYNEEGTDKKHY